MAIEQAFATLRERIKPAVLNSESYANGQVMKAYLDQKGFDWANASDGTLADALYEAVNATAEKLKWLVKPARLAKFDEKPRTLVNAYQEQEEFAARAKKAEADKAQAAKQASLKKELDAFIGNILFVDGLRGQVDHSKTEKIKTACVKHLERGIKEKRDLTAVAKEIRNFVSEEYEKVEKASERV
jgi:hypothetical protein